MTPRTLGPSDPRTVSIEAVTHGRVVIRDAADSSPAGVLVAFHGYSQSAEDILADVLDIPGVDRWRLVAVQGLHRFYARGDEKVVASWMTRQDRDLAIADNIAYVDAALDAVVGTPQKIVLAGFSQGVAMAYRAARRGRHRVAGIIALAGDIPPELKAVGSGPAASGPQPWPPVLIGVGSQETWYTADKLDADLAFLRAAGVPYDVVRFDGAHEWTDPFRHAAGAWLERL